MTIQHLIDWFAEHQNLVLLYFGILLLITLFLVAISNESNFKNLRFVMSGVVYAVTIPGILAVLLTLYSLLMARTSILEVPIVAYFVPIIGMVLCLVILNRKVTMKNIPGFDRLMALMVIIAIAFVIVFVLQKMFFGVFFVGGFAQLAIVFAIVFIILKVAWKRFKK